MEKVYETFNRYPWDTDKLFQAGLDSIIETIPKTNQDDLVEQAQLLKAKHFYFSRFQQDFDLESYLQYEQEKLDQKRNQQQFDRLEKYDYDHDEDYTKGLPNIIRGWVQDQTVNGLWDKEKLQLEFSKAKAFYYVARVEKVDLNAYFSYKAKKEQQNKPACPFANKWMNKGKLGPVKQTNGVSFVVTERTQGPETITLSSPKTKNILSTHRLKDIQSALNKAEANSNVTSIFVTTTVADTSNPFEINERIETKDTKLMSCGLAYNETAALGSDTNRQVSINHLSTTYYNLVRSVLARKDPKLIVTFSNGQIPLNAAYLTLCLGFMRVITEHSLLVFTLDLSHAPIPPLLLLATACGRARTTKPLPAGLDLYLALAAPDYAKLRGPELVYLGLADTFVPETKLADTFDIAKNMAICTAPDTNASIQLALAIHHTYSGPNRLTVWEKYIESVFGAATSFEDLKQRLESHNTPWSKNILKHWSTLPPTLLDVIFKAVKQCQTLTNPIKILDLEKKLNQRWRQSKDYQQWIDGKQDWVDTCTDFYLEQDENVDLDQELVLVYEVPQQVEEEEEETVVCPVTGQKSAGSICPVKGMQEVQIKCPVTGQVSVDGTTTCPASGQQEPAKCPVTDNSGVCPVSGQQQQSTATKDCPLSSQLNDIAPAMENLTL
ncbi:hypothetical protein BDF21DRAFT_452671 [Thamnidium elegans]|nr:hypothetical protein BDF21DRAFT_452671 [Thamnidium elegans]